MKLILSDLPKTWIFDVDGTIVRHNGHLSEKDELLDGVKDFFCKIPHTDKIILLTARKQEFIAQLESFLKENSIRYDFLIANLPTGERILINDMKDSGLKTAFAINTKRDSDLNIEYIIDKNL